MISPMITFDLVLISGRDRVLCAAHAMRIVKPGGFIMLDNAECPEYTPIGPALLKEWDYRRTAQYNCPEAADNGVWATDIWRNPSSRNVANVADDVLVAHGETAAIRGDFESAEVLARLSLEKNQHIADALNLLAIASCSRERINDGYRLLEAAVRVGADQRERRQESGDDMRQTGSTRGRPANKRQHSIESTRSHGS